ncbi:hypothetical protein DL95DRAFT_476456 [Leptodontidium sp. 2 PMI_412]|nr:hypothetical protein DL95DRAFT_476456 [Leptodontidium sp. 2 PMI_412]
MEKGSKERRSKKDSKKSKSSHDRPSHSTPLTKSELRDFDLAGSEGSPLVSRDLLSPLQSSDSSSDAQSEISSRTPGAQTSSAQSSGSSSYAQSESSDRTPSSHTLSTQSSRYSVPSKPSQSNRLAILRYASVLSLEAAHGHLHTDLPRDNLRNPNIPSPAAKTTQNLSLANYIRMEASRRSLSDKDFIYSSRILIYQYVLSMRHRSILHGDGTSLQRCD